MYNKVQGAKLEKKDTKLESDNLKDHPEIWDKIKSGKKVFIKWPSIKECMINLAEREINKS